MTERFLTVALIGMPNAGKSTLINTLVGEKISAVTHKVQTTRHNIRGIVNHKNTQIVFIDTPGLFKPHKTLEKMIVQNALTSLQEADIICVIIDIYKIQTDQYKEILEFISTTKQPIFALINKIDLMPKPQVLPLIEKLSSDFTEIIPISALKKAGIEHLLNFLSTNAKEEPWRYSPDEITDQPMQTIAEEITRQQAFILLHQEIPYSLAVQTEKWEEDAKAVKIYQMIVINKETQKSIVLGKGGSKIKAIGQSARREISKLLGKKVHLYLYVKIKEDWIEKYKI